MSDAPVVGPPTAWVHTGYTQQLHFGAGAVDRLGEVLKGLGARRAMLITTAGRFQSDDGARVRKAMGRILASSFAEAIAHVPTTAVRDAGLEARRDAIDAVVSFGGGSCADLAKAVCYFSEQESGAPGASYADRPSILHVSVPTTYSGAELTPFFGMTDPATRQKQGAGGPTIAPIAAIYDPELTLATPARVSAETGMNALAHCVEAAWSPTRSPEAEAIALAGAHRIHSALPEVVEAPDDLTARSDMLQGAVLGGRCLQNGSMGVHHGLAQLVGGRTGIAHGLANAMILPHAIRFNADTVPSAIAGLALSMGVSDPADAVTDLAARLGLPAGLRECGVTEEDLDAVAQLSQSNGNVSNNPRPVSEEDARAILAAAY